MAQLLRISVTPLPGWGNVGDEESSWARVGDGNGVLQVSHSEDLHGEVPNPNGDDLGKLAVNTAVGQGVDVRGTPQGACGFGFFGSAFVPCGTVAYFQVWVLSNGRDFIFASYIAAAADPLEQGEAEKMALALTLSPRPPVWKFW